MTSLVGQLLSELGADLLPELLPLVAPDTFHVYRRVDADDGGGSFSQTEMKLTRTAVPCAYETSTVTEEIEGGGRVSWTKYTIVAPAFWEGKVLTILKDDKLVIQARRPTPAITIEVNGANSLSGAALLIEGKVNSA